MTFCKDTYSCAEGASALVIVTEWEQFRALDFVRLKKTMRSPVLVDFDDSQSLGASKTGGTRDRKLPIDLEI